MKIVLVTGGFDPVHSGHVEYFNAARELGDKLVVGLNSDDWLVRKKGQAFMPWSERAAVVAALHVVDRVINFDDSDGSAKDAIRKARKIFPNHDKIIFANGGDRTKDNILEMDLLKEYLNLQFVFGVGGEDKKNSSSWILKEWKEPKTERPWGYYRVLYNNLGCKVKELTVNPGQSLSMQRHQHRSEYWLVSEGCAIVNGLLPNGTIVSEIKLNKHAEYHVPVDQWHQLTNPFDAVCKIIEIQYGVTCEETDIERLE
jgi:cytidyltransferase-like protein